MKKAEVEKPGVINLNETSIPKVKSNEVLIEIQAGGICGTDLHIFSREDSFSHPIGHELTGEIIKMGKEVKNFNIGDKVVIDNNSNCGKCKNCKNGKPEYCLNIKDFLEEEKISFQEYVAMPASSVYVFNNLSYQEATLAEPLTVALEMLETAEVKSNQDIAIFGPGPIGLMAARIAKHKGINNIYLTGKSHSTARLKLAEKIGVEDIIEVDNQDVVDYFNRNNLSVDRVLITAPPYTIKDGISILKFGGILTYIGFGFGGEEKVELDFNQVHFNKLQIKATHAIPNRFYPLALDYINKGIITKEDFVTDIFDFKNIQNGFERAKDKDTIKTLINF